LPYTPLNETLGFRKGPTNFDSEGFLNYLQSRAGGKREEKVARPIVSEVIKFYQQFEPSKNYYDTLLNIQNLTTYIQAISEAKPLCATTIGEKLRRFQAAIDYVDYRENATAIDKDFYVRCLKVKESLVKWGKGLKKEKKAQEQANHERSEEQVCFTEWSVVRNIQMLCSML